MDILAIAAVAPAKVINTATRIFLFLNKILKDSIMERFAGEAETVVTAASGTSSLHFHAQNQRSGTDTMEKITVVIK